MVVVGPASAGRKLVGDTWSAFSGWERTALAATIIACILVTTFISNLLRVPRMPEFSPSLVVQTPAFVSLIAALLVILICAVIGSVFAGRSHHDAGIFAAGIGLTTLSVRGGSVGLILQNASGSSVFGALLFELMVLSGFLLGLSMILERLSDARILRDESIDDVQDPPVEMDHPTLRDKLSALAVQTLITLVVVAILLQTDSKKQALMSIFVATFLASVAAHHLFPVRGGIWFWSGPLITGFVAYLSALFMSNPLLLKLGIPPVQIANAVPLDYAGLAVSGAIFGYWASRRWHKERAALAQSIEAAAAGA